VAGPVILDIRPTEPDVYAGMLRGGLMVAELDGFIWVPYSRPCWHCQESTTWVDLAFETPLHPGPCSQAKWDEWRWAEVLHYLRSDEYQRWIANDLR
jgi:hypothetical protein